MLFSNDNSSACARHTDLGCSLCQNSSVVIIMVMLWIQGSLEDILVIFIKWAQYIWTASYKYSHYIHSYNGHDLYILSIILAYIITVMSCISRQTLEFWHKWHPIHWCYTKLYIAATCRTVASLMNIAGEDSGLKHSECDWCSVYVANTHGTSCTSTAMGIRCLIMYTSLTQVIILK